MSAYIDNIKGSRLNSKKKLPYSVQIHLFVICRYSSPLGEKASRRSRQRQGVKGIGENIKNFVRLN